MRVVGVARGREGTVRRRSGAPRDRHPGAPVATSYVLTAVELNSAGATGDSVPHVFRDAAPDVRTAFGGPPRAGGWGPAGATAGVGRPAARCHGGMPGGIRTAVSSAGGTRRLSAIAGSVCASAARPLGGRVRAGAAGPFLRLMPTAALPGDPLRAGEPARVPAEEGERIPVTWRLRSGGTTLSWLVVCNGSPTGGRRLRPVLPRAASTPRQPGARVNAAVRAPVVPRGPAASWRSPTPASRTGPVVPRGSARARPSDRTHRPSQPPSTGRTVPET